MAPDEPTTDYYPPPPPQPPAAPPVKRLVRSRRDRKFAGVCGGLGEYFDLDPIIFRIAFVVLTLAGGGGLLLYGLAWVFVPEEGHRRAIGDSLPGARRGRPHWLPIALLVVGGLMLSGQLSDHHNGGFGFGFTLLAVGGFLLWRRQQRQSPWNDGGHDDVAAPRPPPPPADMYPPRWTPSPDPTDTAGTGAHDPNVPWTAPGVTPWTPADDGVDTGSDAYTAARDPLLDQADELPFSQPPIWPPLALPPEERRPPSMTPVLLSALLLLGGVAALLTTSGVWHVSVAVYLSVALILTGVALVVGSGRARSRGLIALGVVLTLALIVAATVEAPLRDGVGERIYTPATVSQVRQNYRLGAGHVKLDLSHLGSWHGQRVVDMHLGAGELDVIAPSNTNVRIDAESQLGQVQVFGQTRNNGNKLTVVDPKRASSDAPTLVLHLHVRLGQVQVTHAAA